MVTRTEYLRMKGYCEFAPTCPGFYAIDRDCKTSDGGNCDQASLLRDRAERALLENHGVGACDESILRRIKDDKEV